MVWLTDERRLDLIPDLIKPLIKTSIMMESFTITLEGYPESFSKRCVGQVFRREMSVAGSVGRVSTADVT